MAQTQGVVYRCMVYDIHNVDTNMSGITTSQNFGSLVVINSMIMDLSTSGDGKAIAGIVQSGVGPGYVYNCSIGLINGTDGAAYAGIVATNNQIGHTWRNNVVGLPINGICYTSAGGAMTVTYCVSSDGTADDWGGAGNQINKSPTPTGDIKFTNFSPNTSNLHILSGSCCEDTGQDLALAFATYGYPAEDIDGETRPCGEGWEIGADELCGHAPEEGGCCASACCCCRKDWFNGK